VGFTVKEFSCMLLFLSLDDSCSKGQKNRRRKAVVAQFNVRFSAHKK